MVSECKARFKKFILKFIEPVMEDDERVEGMNVDEPLYLQKLEEVRSTFFLIVFICCTAV